MGIINTLKGYWVALVGIATTIFLGYVYFLKKDNESLEVEVENKEKELKVQKEVHKQDIEVEKFQAKQEVYQEEVRKVDEKLEEEVTERNQDEKVDNIPDDSIKLTI